MRAKFLASILLIGAGILAACALASPPTPDFQDPAYRWSADLSQPGADLLVRGQKLEGIKGELNQLIFAINGSDQDPESFRTLEGQEPLGAPKLKLVELRGKVAVVEVINALYLTQRMGSAGADAFLAEATFTLTEHPAVEAVDFQFEEGDHAGPGVYTRQDFLQRWTLVEK